MAGAAWPGCSWRSSERRWSRSSGPARSGARHQGVHAPGVAEAEASLDHWAFNRGKRSVLLDPAGEPADRQVLDRLLAGADVLVESLDPAERDALDLRPTQTTARFPALVHASITGFGVSGPKADWRCSDLVAMAAGGYLVLTGDEDRPPVRISLDQAYHHAAADAAGAVLIALRERHRSGRGQHIDVAAQASLVEATQSFVLAAPYGAPLISACRAGRSCRPSRCGSSIPASTAT